MPTRPSRARLGALAADPHSPQLYAPAPGMKDAREAAGVSLAELAELTGYSSDLLAKIEAGDLPVPRLTTSRISAVLATEHTAVRGEGPQEVTRLKDIVERT